jgi:ankyrin repeat protein/energy-coupling factor transporter ATP-binding protein EcfA2
MIKEWEDLEAIVFETRAIKCLIKMIIEEEIVTVIGSPGCGKTTAIHHVALRLNKDQLYDVVPAVYPSDIRNYYDPERKQLFVFDDMFGKYSIHVQTMQDWNVLSDGIKKIIDGKRVNILLSCRSYIFHQFRNVKLFTNTSCHFLSSDNVLTVDERRGIAMKHLPENETKFIQDMEVFNQYDFFPLLCHLYGRHKTGGIRTFFTRPVSVIKDDLKCLMEEENQTTFATLGLFIIYNNKIEDDMLSRKSPLKTTLDEMSGELKMPYIFSPKIVKEQLDSLTKSYAKKTGSCYSIIHDKYFDILVSFFGEHMFDLLIDLCHSDVLRDRFQLDTIQGEHDECIIIVPEGKYDLYFERLCYHFANGNMDVVFSNKQMQYESYRIKIIALLNNDKQVREVCLSSVQGDNYPLFTIALQGYADVLKVLIELKYDLHTPDETGKTFAFCGYGGSIECVRLLLNNNYDPNICYEEKSPLYSTSVHGHKEVVELLLNNKADPNICYEGESPLYSASFDDYTEIVKLLLNNKADPNICYEEKSPLYSASIHGHKEVVELLLNNKADPNKCCEGESPLHSASLHGHTEIVELLLGNKADPNICYEGESPLYSASLEGHTEIVKLLLNNKADPNICYKERSPLYRASVRGHKEVVELLLNNKADPNICCKEESTLYGATFHVIQKLSNCC